jgi:hypothetical protein
MFHFHLKVQDCIGLQPYPSMLDHIHTYIFLSLSSLELFMTCFFSLTPVLASSVSRPFLIVYYILTWLELFQFFFLLSDITLLDMFLEI